MFDNTSRFTLKSLLVNPSQLEANLKNYLDGFSDNVKEIIDKFDLRNQIRKMAQSDVLHDVIEKFVSDNINLGPNDRKGPDGPSQSGLSNLGMGYVFEELIRTALFRFIALTFSVPRCWRAAGDFQPILGLSMR